GIASSVGKYRNLEKAMRLVRNINKYSRFILLANRGHSNVAGFNQIMTWTSGYPFGVDYSKGIPRFNPGETTTVDLLARGEVDAVLVVGADLGAHLPREAIEHLADIPLISVEVAHCPTTLLSNVVIPDVLNAMECEGTFYRMDNVPIHVRKFAKSPLKETKSTVDTLKQVLAEIKKSKG
ncbi:MAG: formylmethanofuran dehydrogenase subunit B, partial [Candidatus Altiarchaeota archaeon]|nr:formylmethanofuran dehydrogenase subunit B [Candidatus Altiarchaeota archaeon]